MKLVAYDIKNLSGFRTFYKQSANLELLEKFARGNLSCARVEDFPHRDAKACAGSLQASIKRYRMTSIEAHYVKGMVILIKRSKYRQENT